MANVMKEVAKLLGVELEEEFRIEGYTRRYKLSENGLEFWCDTCKDWCPTHGLEEILTGICKIIKPSELILTDTEKDYLSAVIKPFRNRIISIRKYRFNQDEYIGIYVKYYAETDENEMITLPVFKEGTIYKGMELNKDYTLEELGL